MNEHQKELPPVTMEEQAVIDFLRKQPEFFASHPGVLAELRIPHPTPGHTVSLIERQVEVLREQNRELRHQLQTLVQVARENDRLSGKVHTLSLALIEARGLEQTLAALQHSLHTGFNAEAWSLRLFQPWRAPGIENMDILSVEREAATAAGFGTAIENCKPLCGNLRRPQWEHLFASRANDNGSAVVLPLSTRIGHGETAPGCFGLLGIGSADPARYHAGMGTLFINHLGQLIGRVLWPHLIKTS